MSDFRHHAPDRHVPDGPEPSTHGSAGEFLDLEAQALQEFTHTLMAWIRETVTTPPQHILDLGSGTGAGTFQLLDCFPAAQATAVDSSAQLTERLQQRAATAGQADRLQTVEADLNDGLQSIAGFDFVWASSSLHHLKNPDRLLAEIAQALPADGWFVIVESEDVPWFLPTDIGIGRAGLESRCHELLSRRHAEHTPHIAADWRELLTSAGLNPHAERLFELDLSEPTEPIRRFAYGLFRMLRQAAAASFDAEDLATLDVLLDQNDPRGLTNRDDLVLSTVRKVWLAQPA